MVLAKPLGSLVVNPSLNAFSGMDWLHPLQVDLFDFAYSATILEDERGIGSGRRVDEEEEEGLKLRGLKIGFFRRGIVKIMERIRG